MSCYDATENPDPKAWLALDESRRIDLVIDFHRRGDINAKYGRELAALTARGWRS